MFITSPSFGSTVCAKARRRAAELPAASGNDERVKTAGKSTRPRFRLEAKPWLPWSERRETGFRS
jgi:hypothetical protein